MMPEELSTKQRKHLKMLGHGLNPIVQVGLKGLTENVIQQMDKDLSFHELVKVRFACDDREERKRLVSQLAQATGSLRVHSIGRNALLYRQSPEHKIKIP